MAKLRKRKVSKFNKFSLIFFSVSMSLLFLSSLIVNSKNSELTINIQKMNQEIETLKHDNEKLNIEISSLQNKDRVFVIAKDAGLDQNQDNIVSIQGEN